MIPLNIYVKAAAATITAVLGSSSIINISQTVFVQQRNSNSYSVVSNNDNLLTLSQVKSMKRNELLELYLSSNCYTPKNIQDVTGDWKGELLDNNGVIMTAVSSLLTNYLFSRNRSWRGKSFLSNKNTSNLSSSSIETKDENAFLQGINRFEPKSTLLNSNNNSNKLSIQTEHTFDYSLTESRLDQRSSIVLRYKPYQSKLSPWKTMVDELRYLNVVVEEEKVKKARSKTTKKILLGIGSMAWSGGVWNGSPFLLEKVE